MKRTIGALTLQILMLAPALLAVKPTPWDAMRGPYVGTITVTTKTGKKFRGTGSVSFRALDVVGPMGISIPRQDVKEVLIRRPRESCCDALAMGIVPLAFLIDGIRNHDVPKDAIPVIIIASPLIVGVSAVTGPPLLVIGGLRRLKPTKVLYKVVP